MPVFGINRQLHCTLLYVLIRPAWRHLLECGIVGDRSWFASLQVVGDMSIHVADQGDADADDEAPAESRIQAAEKDRVARMLSNLKVPC